MSDKRPVEQESYVEGWRDAIEYFGDGGPAQSGRSRDSGDRTTAAVVVSASVPPPPKRIQRKRTNGWRMPEGAVYVGRPSQWGNPFQVDRATSPQWSAELAVDAYQVHLASYFGWEDRMLRRAFHPWPVESRAFEDWIAPLRGRDLACWCPLDQPCHADVLLELANR